MSNLKEKNINGLYVELIRLEQSGEHERALKTTNKILHVAPSDSKVFHCKIVCLIQSGKFDEALLALNRNKDLAVDLHFEKAYCQYRLNLPEQALQTVNAAPTLNLQLTEIKAQLLYRLEKYEECYNLYRDIIKNSSDDYNDERQANLCAVASHMNNKTVTERKDPTYEIVYNNVCHLIEKKQYADAEQRLHLCEKLCRDSLEDDGCTEEEIEQELAVIKVQRAYCYQKQGRNKEAHELYSSVLKLKSEDIGLVAITSNNLVVINKGQNVFDSKKKMKYALQESLNHKLNSYQRKLIALNNCLLTYYMNQPELCRKLCDSLVQKWPEMTVKATMVKANLLSREGEIQKAVELLENGCKTMPSDKLLLQLTAVHLLLMQDQKKKACEILQSLDEATYRPGIVGALVKLHLGLGDETGAAKIFEDTVSWYKKQKLSQGDLGYMWMQAAEFHMRLGHSAVAAGSLEELLKSNAGDKRTFAKLIMAYIQFDKEKAKKLCQELPSAETLTKGLNENDIETTISIFGTKSQRNKESSPGTPRSKSELLIKKKLRKRKGKLPKDYNAEISPNPERWLPKYERAGYKKKRDRRVKEVIKGSQGTSNPADIFDFSKVAEQNQEELENIDPKNSIQMSGNMKKGQHQQQKKKRKGSKW